MANAGNQDNVEDGLETSVFSEDMSLNQGVLVHEARSGGKIIPRLIPNDASRISDDGIKELSIVESNDSQDAMESPIAALKQTKHAAGFNEAHAQIKTDEKAGIWESQVIRER